MGDLFEVKPPAKDTVTVAVLPIQNATFHPIRITGKPNQITRFLEEFLKKSLRFKYNEDDITFVPKSLEAILTQRLYNAHYNVLEPNAVYRIFEEMGIMSTDRELNIEEITPHIPADWLLLVTLTQWEGDKFEKLGHGKVSYQMVLVDTRLKEAIWQKTKDNLRFEAPKRSMPYSRQGGETLNEVAKNMLKGMPKPENIVDYKNREKQGEEVQATEAGQNPAQ